MGQSIAGICVNNGFDTDGFDLGRELELEWKFQKKVSAETAFERHKKKGVYDVCFLENVTLILTELETGIWGRTSENMEVFSFVIQESTMTFSFKWSLNSKFEQRYFRVENDVVDDEVSIGEPLPIENLYKDYADLIEAQIKKTTGFSLIDFSDKEFYRFKWVGSEKLLQDIEYALRSGYFYKYMDSRLISSYTPEEQIRLFEIFHQYALENKVDVYHYMTLGNSEGIIPVETVFKSNYQGVIRILLENPETESVVKRYYTTKQTDWLFGIDPTDEKFYNKVLNDHLKTEENFIQNIEELKEEKKDKKWWEFWK
ncbi:hypothetical protein [Flavobacterium macacae]|uniref:Uncharacterized protein n=1 Tax=Flavobacterium macacae TaxID=2488993 RepID=A0A3P3WJE8_9FLAO|nr:hypothetical protein [Flavobacterium macacae]RRJ92913.1 hypothetical protein EG849_04810 [Flavobacterium macacae]